MGSILYTHQDEKIRSLHLAKSFFDDARGATAVEYGLIATLLSLVVVGGIGLSYDAIEFLFSDNNSEIQQALN